MAAFNFSDLPVTQLRLVDAIASTGTGQTITFEWDEGDTGPFKQVDNTPANDTLLTEIPYVASARLGTTKREGMWFTNGTSNYLVDGIRQATYTLSVRGILNSNTSNPPTTSNTRNYRSHLAQSVGVCGESWLLKNLETTFSAATTDETVTAGEALDTTSAALGVSLHTDGKYYKYHQTNYPNLQGVAEKGQNLAVDDSFTLKNLKGSSVLNTGLTAGALYYVQDGGTLTTTFASGVAFLGKAKTATQIDHALQFNATAGSDAQITAGTNTDPQIWSAAQIKLGAETHAQIKVKTLIPKSAAMEEGSITTLSVTSNTTAYYTMNTFPFGIDVNKVSTELSTASTPSSYDVVIYAEDGQSQLFNFTSGTPSASSVDTTTLGAEEALSPGNYIIGLVANNSVNQNFRATSLSPYIRGGVTSEPILCYTETVTAGTLPAATDPTAGTEFGASIIFRFDN